VSSGRLNAQLKKLNGPINIDAASGSVNLDLPKTANFTLDAQASSGDIRCDFPLQNSSINKNEDIKGTYGTGKHKVNISISSGDVHLY
jgi:lia operon protein LiaG